MKPSDIDRSLFSVDHNMPKFFQADGTTYRSGDRLIRNDLAWSLQQISEQGAEGLCGASDPGKPDSPAAGYEADNVNVIESTGGWAVSAIAIAACVSSES